MEEKCFLECEKQGRLCAWCTSSATDRLEIEQKVKSGEWCDICACPTDPYGHFRRCNYENEYDCPKCDFESLEKQRIAIEAWRRNEIERIRRGPEHINASGDKIVSEPDEVLEREE